MRIIAQTLQYMAGNIASNVFTGTENTYIADALDYAISPLLT